MIDPVALRTFIYDRILGRGTPPSTAEIAQHLGTDQASARSDLAGLNIGKTVLPHPETGEIWMAGPFSAVPTAYRVTGSRAQWWANCAWDMLGIAVVTRERVRVDTECADCHEPWSMIVEPDRAPTSDGLVHFLVPASQWYADIGFT